MRVECPAYCEETLLEQTTVNRWMFLTAEVFAGGNPLPGNGYTSPSYATETIVTSTCGCCQQPCNSKIPIKGSASHQYPPQTITEFPQGTQEYTFPDVTFFVRLSQWIKRQEARTTEVAPIVRPLGAKVKLWWRGVVKV